MSVTLVSYALTSLAKVKTYLGITDSTYDATLTQTINAVTDYIENYCGGRRFKSTTYSVANNNIEMYDTNRQTKIFLNQYPVTAVNSVEYRGGTISSPVWITYDANGYLPYLKEGYLRFFNVLPKMAQSFRIGYTAGYLIDFDNEGSSSHTLPLDLALVATELTAQIHQYRTSVGVKKVSTEGQSIEYDISVGSQVTDAHKGILSKYQANRFMI